MGSGSKILRSGMDLKADGRYENLACEEPVIVPTLFISGVEVEENGHFVHMVGWELIPAMGAEPASRRITLRFAMALDVARLFRAELGVALKEGH